MKIGYARVSTADQRPDLQEEALRAAGCERIYTDRVSGRASDRQELLKALDQLRNGDTIVVWKLDRLARSVKLLVTLVGDFERDGVTFVSITPTPSIRVPRRAGSSSTSWQALPRWSVTSSSSGRERD